MYSDIDTTPDVVCPFYHAEEGLRIKCEGYCSTNTLQICFTSKEYYKSHKFTHCMNMKGYRQCPLYGVINKQYE